MSSSPLKFIRSRAQGGFALLITIILVAFLVLILVGLATFTRVENQVADNSADVAKARQNAMTALNLAVGQLQRQAGPDARVTARSDLVGGAAGQPYFTGVWDTTAAITGTPTAWLVSGTEGTAAANSTAGIIAPGTATQPYDDATGTVFVLYDGAVGSANPANRIRLNKQPIQVPEAALPGYPASATTPVTIGNYAYWVADEGVKASVSVVAPSLATLNYDNDGAVPGGDDWSQPLASATQQSGDRLRDRLSQFGQPYRRVDEFYPNLNYTTGSTAAELSRVTTVDQIRFVTSSAGSEAVRMTNFNDQYHNITPIARGVLARTDSDTSTDRLRRDWSAVASTASGSNTGARDYWVVRPDTFAGSDLFSAQYGIKGRKTTASSGLEYAVAPVLSEAGLFIAIDANGGAGSNEPMLSCTLTAEFWNPYAATLVTASGANLRVRVRTSSALNFSLSDNAITHNLSIPAGDIITVTMAAGESFSPGSVRQMRGNASDEFGGTIAKRPIPGSPASGTPVALPVGTATLPAVAAGTITIILEENQSGSGIWTPLQTFDLEERVTESGVSESGAGYYAGYGYELNRNFALWSDPETANARDPRLATFTPANHFEALSTGASSHWAQTASFSQDPGGIAGELPFNNSRSVVLFDLPRQEITAVAQLRHLIGDRPYDVMRGTSAANADDRRLFDSTFVSTVPRNYTAWNFETQARPNRYLEVYVPAQVPAGEFDTAANRVASLRHEQRSARYQLIRGAFNINSTSVAAWSSVLGSTLTNWDTDDDAATDVSRAFFRTPHGAQTKGLDDLVITNISGDTPAAPAGALLDDGSALGAVGRRLTAAEIDTLAQDIVDELIARGRPFASLAEFLASNVLRDAITAAGINNTLSATPYNYRYAAGALTPGDIIAAIAPFMSARSDTFKIRAYGDVRNPTTETITARVWCEAIVQRVPDLAPSPGDPNAASAAVATVLTGNPSTYTFGRQFKIVSFRWLNTDDI